MAIPTVASAQAPASEIVLHNFQDLADPWAGVIQDSAGNLYGTTYYGGTANAGVVYKLDTSGHYTVLYSFMGGADGANPYAGVILDSAGNLYGTTEEGGENNGVVYKLDTTGHETVLYRFTGMPDGTDPRGGVILDSAGNLYGTTTLGGATNQGVVYKLDTTGHETVLYSFTGGADGAFPYAGVIRDSAGNLYGTTPMAPPHAGVGYKLNRKVAVYQVHSGPAGVVLRLFLSDSLAFAEDIPARRFRFNSNLYDSEGAQIYRRTLSAVISGNLYLEALNGKTLRLRTREDVAFAGSSGEIRTLRVERAPDKPLSIRFHAVVSGAETGSQTHPHSIMPSYLEWLSVRHNLLLMWGSFAYVVAVASAVLKWLKWEAV
jgi:uncharacterized repeat protein (TIGR03803 family)